VIRQRLGRAFALATSGLLPAVMSPPVGWIFLQPLAWLPAIAVLSRLSGARAFLAGWAVGTLANLAVFYWIAGTIARFSNLPALAGYAVLGLVAAVFGAYVGVFALGLRRVLRTSGSLWPFAVSAWFVTCETLNPQLFPYLQGVGWFEYPRVFLLSSLTGIPGISFGILLANGLALQALLRRWPALAEPGLDDSTRALVRNAALGAALLAACVAWTGWRLDQIARVEAATEPLRVGLVQSGIGRTQRKAWLKADRESVTRGLLAQSEQALRDHPDLDVLVWPEGELPLPADHPRSLPVRAFARDHAVEIWTGGPHYAKSPEGARERYNSAYRIRSNGRVARRYDKNVLLPFGEFVPFEDRIPWLAKLKGPGRMTAGNELVVHDDGPARFVFMICYEAILSFYVRDAVRRDIDLLVNVTYDGWFGDTSEPHQHLMLAVAQAAQHGIPLVRSTTTGVSAVTSASGEFLGRSQPFRSEVVVAEVRPARVPAPYTRLGDWFAWGCAAASALLILRGRRVAPPNRASQPPATAPAGR
jgi:apolipoprotein N-acyltransferase